VNEQEAAEAVAAFVDETLPDLEGRVSDHVVAGKGQLPDAVCDVTQKRVQQGDDDLFPFASIQQSWLRIFDVEVSVMTSLELDPGDYASEEALSTAVAEAEQQQLRAFGAALEAAVFAANFKIGSCMVSPTMLVDYGAPFVEYDDGTRGRQFVWTFSIGEKIPELS
jgi:hypothetical protein